MLYGKKLLVLFLFLTSLVAGQEIFLDRFNTVSYANNNGSSNFSTNWNEVNDGTDSPTAGTIRVVSNQLRFRELTGQYIFRRLNLAGTTSATLTFDYNTNNIGDEDLSLWMLRNDNTFLFIGNLPSGNATYTFNLPANLRYSGSGIAFASSSGNWNAGERVFIDNVRFSATFDPALLPRPYEERESVNVQGNFRMRGNTNIECVSNCPASPDINNPPAVMGYADVDGNGVYHQFK